MAPDTLSEAIALIKAGEKAEAQKLLEPFIEANPRNVTAWMWEADTWPTLPGKIKVLEMCLQHNPENQQAKLALAKLKEQPAPKSNGTSGTTAAGNQEALQTSSKKGTRPLATQSKRCPNCRLWNDGPATKCVCGYDFGLKKKVIVPVQSSSLPPPSSRGLETTPKVDSAIATPVEGKSESGRKLKPCPYCAEMIQEAAIVCRFCGRDVKTPSIAVPTPRQEGPIVNRPPAVVTVTQERKPTSGPQILGVVSILFGVVGFLVAGIPLGTLAIICGIVALAVGATSGLGGIIIGIMIKD